MNNKILFIIILLLLLFVVTEVLLESYSKPILELSTNESTSIYKITYYRSHAVYSSYANGFTGPTSAVTKDLKYTENVNFKQLIKDIKNIPQNNQTNTAKINISVSGKKYSATRDNAIVVKLLDIVDIKFLTMSDLLK